MRLEAHDCFGSPINQEVSRVVVYDDYDNPILVALKYGKGMCYAGVIGDKTFDEVLRMLGINKMTIVDSVSPKGVTDKPGSLIL